MEEMNNEIESTETEPSKRDELIKILDAQYETLKERGCPDQILNILKDQREDVLAKAEEMNVGEGNLPVLPIIPDTYLSAYSLMSMVRNAEKAGCNYLKTSDIKNVVEVSDEPYYIFDVDIGKSTLSTSPQDAEKRVNEQGRRCLTADEVINLCIHTDVFSNYNIFACGSRYGMNGVPNVTLSGGACPSLGWVQASFTGGRWVSASCAIVSKIVSKAESETEFRSEGCSSDQHGCG